jgi:HK97 family phage major capsid protein/HK97 family phage prohead protease
MRGYSTIQFRAVDEEKRIIEGTATTPTLARDGDILETDGIEYKLPLPFLLGHRSDSPLGNVVSATVSKTGITVRIQIAPEGTAEHIDEAWRMIKANLIRGLSIGWRTIAEMYDKTIGGFRIMKSEWLELSAVVVPADANCTITSIRSLDSKALAASGSRRSEVIRLDTSNAPGASGKLKDKSMKIREQITQFENKRAANQVAMDDILTNSTKDGIRTLDEAEQESYDTLAEENVQIDKHLVRLRAQEKRQIEEAARVDTTNATDPAAARRQAEDRGRGTVSVRPNVEKGTAFVRLAMAMARSRGNRFEALHFVRSLQSWMDQTPEVELHLRTVVEAGDTTTSGWASQLVPNAHQLENEFLDLLRPETLLGRIGGFMMCPFNVSVPLATADGTHAWVGEDVSAPVGKLTLSNATLEWAKTASIIAITRELAMLSTPQAESVVRNALLKGNAAYLDAQFVGTAAAVTKTSPAGILNGIGSTGVSGTTPAAFLTDLNTLLGKFATNNQNIQGLVLMTSLNQLLPISLMKSSLGNRLYPEVSIRRLPDGTNGTISGIPVYASNAISAKIIGMVASDIMMADANQAEIDISTEASLEMNTVPLGGDQSPLTTSVVMKSLWQAGLIGIKITRPITWKVARSSAVEYLTSTGYLTA